MGEIKTHADAFMTIGHIAQGHKRFRSEFLADTKTFDSDLARKTYLLISNCLKSSFIKTCLYAFLEKCSALKQKSH